MPFQHTPWVRQGRLLTAQKEVIWLDTPDWFAWLDQTASFCYLGTHPLIRLTVRREKRRRQTYWYAYCKYERKLHNVYLGKSKQLTQDRLEAACQTIAQRVRRTQALNDA